VGGFHVIVVVIAVFGLPYYRVKVNITEQEVEGNNNKYIEQNPQDKPHMKDPKTSRNSQHVPLPWRGDK
jgi:hypothetical protein